MEIHWAIKGLRYAVALAFLTIVFPSAGQQRAPTLAPTPTPAPPQKSAEKSAEAWASEPMVDLARACPTIRIELRYASKRNVTGKPIYPVNARCFVRQSVAQRLQYAQDELNDKGYALKIWDAYRPEWAQKILWQAIRNPDFLQPPDQTASMHTRGIAVDATLVTFEGGELRMPTGFDDFTPAASMFYKGGDHDVARHLRILQIAMGKAGFLGNHTEWWHFVARDWENCQPLDLDIQPHIERNARLTRK